MSDPQSPAPDPLPSSWSADEADAVDRAGRSKVLTIVVALVAVLLVGAGAVFLINRGGSEERAWPTSVDGRPAGLGENGDTVADVLPNVDGGVETGPGVFLWSGFDGWHLWVVNGPDLQGVSGTITSDEAFATAVLSSPDSGSVASDGKTVTFDLDGSVPLAGIDFGPDFYAKEMTVALEGPDGQPVEASVVTLGADTPADAVPVVLEKAVVEAP